MNYHVTSDIQHPVHSGVVSCRNVPDFVRFDGQNNFVGQIEGGRKCGVHCHFLAVRHYIYKQRAKPETLRCMKSCQCVTGVHWIISDKYITGLLDYFKNTALAAQLRQIVSLRTWCVPAKFWIRWSRPTTAYKMVCYCSEGYCAAEGNSTGHRAALSCSSEAKVRTAVLARRRSVASSWKSSLWCCRLQEAQRLYSSLDLLWCLWTLDALCVWVSEWVSE